MKPAAWLLIFAPICVAAPTLRLQNTAVYLDVVVGGLGGNQTLEAFNIGDGSLSLSVSAPSASWLAVSIGETHPCSFRNSSCIPLRFALRTGNLARGTYADEVTISDPNAIDAPQVVTVILHVGGQGPTALDLYMAPGTPASVSLFNYPSSFCESWPCPSVVATTTQDGGLWLSVAATGMGTLRFYYSYDIRVTPPATMALGTYNGTIAVKDSGFNDSRTIPITMHLTTQPIAKPSTDRISLRLAQGGPAATYPFVPSISLSNTGMGKLEVQDVTATGAGISAHDYAGLAIVTVDPGSLAPGLYTDGLVTIQCNAANCPIQIPVSLEIVAQSRPLIFYRGVVDRVTFQQVPVAQGEVVVVTGEQLSLRAPESAPVVPLPTSLGGTTVLVNGEPAPLYYSSFGQIAFEMPTTTTLGTALVQVQRDGQASNTASVDLVERAPRIVTVTDLSYNVLDFSHPAKIGDTLIIWAIGLGPTNPAVPDGAASPASPAAVVTVMPTVGVCHNVAPSFAGLSPGGVGLYQIMVKVPSDTPRGGCYVWLQFPGEIFSNSTIIPVQ